MSSSSFSEQEEDYNEIILEKWRLKRKFDDHESSTSNSSSSSDRDLAGCSRRERSTGDRILCERIPKIKKKSENRESSSSTSSPSSSPSKDRFKTKRRRRCVTERDIVDGEHSERREIREVSREPSPTVSVDGSVPDVAPEVPTSPLGHDDVNQGDVIGAIEISPNSSVLGDVNESSQSSALSYSSHPSSSMTSNSSSQDLQYFDPDVEKLYPNSAHTVSDVCVALAQISEKHNMSNVAVADILTLMSQTLPNENKMPKSSYLFTKSVETLFEGYVEHKSETGKSSLFLFDIERQLEAVLSENWDAVMQRRQQIIDSTQEDLAAWYGTLYAEHVKNGVTLESISISLALYIDSAPAFKKAKGSLYFILGQILELPANLKLSDFNTLVLGICSGEEKFNHNFLLSKVVDKITNLEFCRVKINNLDTNLHVWVHSILADLPGKAFICNQKQFNGKFGCSLCLHPGQLLAAGKPTRVYPYKEGVPLRSPESITQHADTMQNNRDPNISSIFGIKGPTPLSKIIEIPTQIPLDPMHLIDEGAFKRTLLVLFSPEYRDSDFSIRRHLGEINQLLDQIKTPHDVHRGAKLVTSEMKGFKASEFRFLLSHCVPCFANILPEPYFKHLISLSLGIKLLNMPIISEDNLLKAKLHLTYFCSSFEELYFLKNCTYNVHGVLHLADQVPKIGPLNMVSGYPFESTIGVIKRHSHGSRNVTEQTVKFVVAHKNLLVYHQDKIRKQEPTLLDKTSTFKRKRRQELDPLGLCSAILPYTPLNIENNYKIFLSECPNLYEHNEEINNMNSISIVSRIMNKDRQIIHSLKYNRIQNSCSYMVGWKEGIHYKYGSCNFFFKLGNSLLADVTEFETSFYRPITEGMIDSIGHFISVVNLTHKKNIVNCDAIFGRVVFAPCRKKTGSNIIGYLTNVPALEHD